MRCAKTRKGSLSISTNAIVILIVAVIMLGLIIGLVTRGFSAVERQFIGQIEENEPEPPSPSPSNPVTLSTQAKISSRGELVGFKVNILNTESEELELEPQIDCGENNEDLLAKDTEGPQSGLAQYDDQAFPKTLGTNDIGSFTYLFTINDAAAEGVYLCQMGASGETAGDANPEDIQSTEFKLTIE